MVLRPEKSDPLTRNFFLGIFYTQAVNLKHDFQEILLLNLSPLYPDQKFLILPLGDLKDDGSDQSYLMKSNEKGLNSGLKDPDAYVNAYSYEEIANILFGKWALIINNLCILFYLFSCQCSYMTLIKVISPLRSAGCV